MKFWIDGDSCPKPAMDVILKLHQAESFELTVLADRVLPGVTDAGGHLRIVSHGSGSVDDVLVEETAPGDWVVTRDLALGVRLLEKGISVMNDRGRIWDSRSLRRRLEEAEIMKAARAGGIARGGGRSYDSADKKAFADSMSRIINGSRSHP